MHSQGPGTRASLPLPGVQPLPVVSTDLAHLLFGSSTGRRAPTREEGTHTQHVPFQGKVPMLHTALLPSSFLLPDSGCDAWSCSHHLVTLWSEIREGGKQHRDVGPCWLHAPTQTTTCPHWVFCGLQPNAPLTWAGKGRQFSTVVRRAAHEPGPPGLNPVTEQDPRGPPGTSPPLHPLRGSSLKHPDGSL